MSSSTSASARLTLARQPTLILSALKVTVLINCGTHLIHFTVGMLPLTIKPVLSYTAVDMLTQVMIGLTVS